MYKINQICDNICKEKIKCCCEKVNTLHKIIEYEYNYDYKKIVKYCFSNDILKIKHDLGDMCYKHKVILSNFNKDIKKIIRKEHFIILNQFFCKDLCYIIISFFMF